jgi:4-oxalomesaconate hydratase
MLTPPEGAGAVEQEREDDVMTTSVGRRPLLVVGAHAADFVWRAGGVIAKHTAAGWEATVVALSYSSTASARRRWTTSTSPTIPASASARSRRALRAIGRSGRYGCGGRYQPEDYPDRAERGIRYHLTA